MLVEFAWIDEEDFLIEAADVVPDVVIVVGDVKVDPFGAKGEPEIDFLF